VIVLGLDPGTAIVGWGLVSIDAETDTVTCLGYGCIITDKSLPDGKRLVAISQGITQLLLEHSPDQITVEKIFFTTNRKTAMGVAQARGVILCALEACGAEVLEFNPMQVKLALTGYGRSDKKAVQNAVKEYFGLETIPKPDDAADALAIAVTAHLRGKRDLVEEGAAPVEKVKKPRSPRKPKGEAAVA